MSGSSSSVILAFDVDGTITEPKQEIEPKMLNRLLELSNIWIVTAGSEEACKRQLGPVLFNHAQHVFCKYGYIHKWPNGFITREFVEVDSNNDLGRRYTIRSGRSSIDYTNRLKDWCVQFADKPIHYFGNEPYGNDQSMFCHPLVKAIQVKDWKDTLCAVNSY